MWPQIQKVCFELQPHDLVKVVKQNDAAELKPSAPHSFHSSCHQLSGPLQSKLISEISVFNERQFRKI